MTLDRIPHGVARAILAKPKRMLLLQSSEAATAQTKIFRRIASHTRSDARLTPALPEGICKPTGAVLTDNRRDVGAVMCAIIICRTSRGVSETTRL